MIHERLKVLADGTILHRREIQTELAEWVEVAPRIWTRRVREGE